MKQFNLERALSGDPVITRAGNIVTGIHISPYNKNEVIGTAWERLKLNKEIISHHSYIWSLSGNFSDGRDNDLFMAPKKVKRYIWVSYELEHMIVMGNVVHFTTGVYSSRNDLIEICNNNKEGQIIEIEIEE